VEQRLSRTPLFDCTRRTSAAFAALVLAATVAAAQAPATPPARTESLGGDGYVVFLAGRMVGREELSVSRQADGWILRGTSRLNPPVGTTVKHVEVRYDPQWRPLGLELVGTVQGTEVTLNTTFAAGKAVNKLTEAGQETEKVDAISADPVVLPNVFFGSYAALAARLVTATFGSEFKVYVAPQAEISAVVTEVTNERIETPRATFAVKRYAMTMKNPGGELRITIWIDEAGRLIRLSVPSQSLEVAREDVASAASRMTAFSIDGDESVRIAANGFNLAATVTRPQGDARLLPAVVLIGGSGPADRDGVVAGIPVIGQLAKGLVDAGFLVVRYDKRGVGQSGGRVETATIGDYVEDARAVVTYLRKQREDVDDDRVAVVGHSEGAWIALQLAASTGDVRALTLIAASSGTGGALVLEQQQHMLNVMKVPDAEKKEKAELQTRINAAATGKGSWDGVPDGLRKQADIPWFASFLAFDPARPMKDARQPILIVQGELDMQVRAYHADRLVELAKARKRQVPVEVVKVPGVNHLLVPAKTGEVAEYSTLGDQQVSPDVTGAIGGWLTRTMGPGRAERP
jgi:pimeloyl-ACP methyl ester carboxylesterase